MIEDDAAQDLCKLTPEDGDGVVGARNMQAGTAGIDDGAVGLGRLEFRASLSDNHSVDGQLPGLLVRSELEAVGEHRLDHQLFLLPCLVGRKVTQLGVDRGVRLGVDIEHCGVEPRWAANDLRLGKTVGELDKIFR